MTKAKGQTISPPAGEENGWKAVSQGLHRVAEGLDRVAKLVALLVAEGKTKTEAMLALNQVGLSPSEIAALLGTTPNTVSVALHQARKAAGKGRTGGARTRR